MTYLSDLQTEIGEINEKSGFNQAQDVPEEYRPFYYSTKIMLMVTELAEAAEEIRKGRAVDEEYLGYPPVPASLAVEFPSGGDATEHWQAHTVGKPEGVPSELADTVIRAFSFAYEAGIDLDAVIHNKLAYNRTRELKHGKRF